RFSANVFRQFAAEAGNTPEFSEYERVLAQHLFLKVDSVLTELENKRQSSSHPDDKAPFVWSNVNMRKLALDAVHRVKLGLDALIPNHIHPIPYFNGKEKKYDLDLRVGYTGKDHYRRENARVKPVDVRYELVYSTDKFRPVKKSIHDDVEGYEFEITNPFERGEVVGGFGYIDFGTENQWLNQLVLVSKKDFDRSKSAAKSSDFWGKYPVEMMYKTLVHRTTEKLPLDPRSVNAASYAYVEQQESDADIVTEQIIEDGANATVIDAEALMPAKREPLPPPPAETPAGTPPSSGYSGEVPF
ncbi:MAG: recombinase RecT, partial [Oscillospiraceae bacterium]|nr:recombinase RecT [Oscillospiraceae bacterium]